MQFSELRVGQKARIIGLKMGDRVYRQKLISMGLIPGAILTVVRMAPLRDPIEILVNGFTLSLRKNEASMMQIEEVSA